MRFAKLPFKSWHTPTTLAQFDQDFLATLTPVMRDALLHYRAGYPTSSEFLIEIAKVMENFIADAFAIEKELRASSLSTTQYDPIFSFKKHIVREARRKLSSKDPLPDFTLLDHWIKKESAAHFPETDLELSVARFALSKLDIPEDLLRVTQWCIHQLRRGSPWVSFQVPQKLDFEQLIPVELHETYHEIAKSQHHFRDGFDLTDHGMSEKEIQSEVHYCVYCHTKEDDFCRKGFPVKKKEPDLGFKKNPLDVLLTGCPLDENISEMNLLKKEGHTIASLAMVMRENPLCALTGHRICNDCMKSCIYQKQEPVNIPQIETRVLRDALQLPWGVEIYDLLMQWNPLRQTQFLPQAYQHKNVMIAGLGPAGITLAHHLLMEGCAVVGFDGLKIEPLAEKFLQEPIHDYQTIVDKLDERILAGFGGVAEYGITVRWDKNFLKLLYIVMMRRAHFQAYGNVRFGGTITVEDAWRLGFNHLAVAVGAGLPKALPIPGSLAPGMRQANDFLMALQLTGAAKKNSLANLQLRMPILVIGGGLTGVDTATEAQAYYLLQIEKTLHRYEILCAQGGEEKIRAKFNDLDLSILDEHLAHARLVRAEREKAHLENRKTMLQSLLRSWGGVTIIYRRRMQESPAYICNHEELHNALAEGVLYAENIWPKEVLLDHQGQVQALRYRLRHHEADGQWIVREEDLERPARSILVATGAQLNIAYAFEHKNTFKRDGMQYQPFDLIDGELIAVPIAEHCKADHFGPFTSYQKEDKRVSFIGDSHPVFQGNVVKAIASAKRSYPSIVNALSLSTPATADYSNFRASIHDYFSAKILLIISGETTELLIRSPMAVFHFKPGQFYRLQNFEVDARFVHDTLLHMEAISIFVASVDQEAQTLTAFVMDQGASSHLVKYLQPGQRIALMGPTGVESRVKEDDETILIIGGELAAVQALAWGYALKGKANPLIFLAEDSPRVRAHEEALKAVGTNVQWSTDLLGTFENYVKTSLATSHRILIVTSPSQLKQFNAVRQTFKNYFHDKVKIFASTYTPMQCMLKGVCAQCLQWQIDPHTGQRTKAVFGCSWQHQPLDFIDIDNLEQRLSQNHMQETLSRLWLNYILR